MKSKTIFECTKCGRESSQWLGQCPDCQSWNSFAEAVVSSRSVKNSVAGRKRSAGLALQIRPFADTELSKEKLLRRSTGFSCLDSCLGGGMLDGSLILLGGAPGIGKSTLMAQIAGHWAGRNLSVFYASGEEEVSQIEERLIRLGAPKSPELLLGSSLTLEDILWKAGEIIPRLLIVDSIQTIASETLDYPQASPALIREATARLMSLAKKEKIAVLLSGHITKEGFLAGPKHLEHMVDVVLQMEKPRSEEYRLLRVLKNRFGPSCALAVFEMTQGGFKEVADPSQSFISEHWRQRLKAEPARVGLASSFALDGGQIFLVQAEALLGKRKLSPGRRSSLGIEYSRLEMLLAVLEKSLGISLESHDVYLSLIGGIRVKDPGIDLALLMALGSVVLEAAVPTDAAFLGEVSLSGEVLPPRDLNARIRQAKALGFAKIFHAREGLWKIGDFLSILQKKA